MKINSIRVSKILLIVTLAVLQWPVMTFSFNSAPPGEPHPKTLAHRELKGIARQSQSTGPVITAGLQAKPVSSSRIHPAWKASRNNAAGSKIDLPSGDSLSASATPPDPKASFHTLVGAGDIGDNGWFKGKAKATAKLIDDIVAKAPDTVVFTAGDNAYSSGTSREFQKNYGPTWGRHRLRTFPSPGNHDHKTHNATGYLDYFCPTANDCVFPGKIKQLNYSYDLGNWHIISLDSEKNYKRGSSQVEWLKKDLAEHSGSCILAYFHHPFYSSGKHGNSSKPKEFWKELYKAGADIVVAAHDHNYERFAKQDLNGNPDPNGIRSFVVGTGGRSLRKFKKPIPNSEARYNSSNGVIKFTLRNDGYDWEFIPVAGATFSDKGSDNCKMGGNPLPPSGDPPGR